MFPLMLSDLEIARMVTLKPIQEIAKELGILDKDLIPYGRFKAKISHQLANEKQGKLILVTAISPTKAGVGKTTTSVGLGLGMARIGKQTIVALREPSLGPCFGMKGGAAGGGHAQVLPMEEINLHFTGDFHAITTANNTLAALVDNHAFHLRKSGNPFREILWKRVLDVNDRSLRNVITGLGGKAHGLPREAGFDITPASEIMAILCLADSLEDLRTRIDNIAVAIDHSGNAVLVRDLGFGGAILALLKDAFEPNLVQTTENTPAIIHGGPFANIAHGCNSLIATKTALSLADYVVTEAGFGADLGAEKFFDIKCRIGQLSPKATMLVVTSQALKLHGGVEVSAMSDPNIEGIKKGMTNLERHLDNLQKFGQKVIVAFNRFHFDQPDEIKCLKEWCDHQGVSFAVNDSFGQGGEGAIELAEAVAKVADHSPSEPLSFAYELEEPIETKIEKVVKNLYRGEGVQFSEKARAAIRSIRKQDQANLPICIAKTQYSFSDDPSAVGAASGFTLQIEDVILNRGAGFLVAVAGQIMRMPGLPKTPQAIHIDLVDGQIDGLS